MDALTKPAHPAWVGIEVLALMHPYFDKDTPSAVRVRISEKWQTALAEFPEWAIQRACAWWTGADNQDRAKTPKEGDIAARCRVEMNVVNAARLRLNGPVKFAWEQTDDRPPVSTEARERMAAKVAEIHSDMAQRVGGRDA